MRGRRDLVSYFNVTLNFAFQQSLSYELMSYRSRTANELQMLVCIVCCKDLPFKSRIQDGLVGQFQKSSITSGLQ